MEIFNPLKVPGWDDLLADCPGAAIFHSAAWARVLHEAYGYQPCFLGRLEKQGFRILLPCMEVRSAVTGRRGVALPFTDYCEPLLSEGRDFHRLFEAALSHGRKTGWRTLEVRAGTLLPADIPASAQYLCHTLDLSRGEDALFKGLRESTRRNIRKSRRNGVEATLATSRKALDEFCRLNGLTRKLHGLPPQPYRFFTTLQERLLAPGHGLVVLASHQDEVIAGAVFLHFRDRAVYKYGASNKRHQYLRANNLVMWEAIRWYARQGFRSLSFGRTEMENDGLLQFKRGWGATEKTIAYTKYDLRHATFVTASPPVAGVHNKVFAAMPLPLLRLAGALLYRHFG